MGPETTCSQLPGVLVCRPNRAGRGRHKGPESPPPGQASGDRGTMGDNGALGHTKDDLLTVGHCWFLLWGLAAVPEAEGIRTHNAWCLYSTPFRDRIVLVWNTLGLLPRPAPLPGLCRLFPTHPRRVGQAAGH